MAAKCEKLNSNPLHSSPFYGILFVTWVGEGAVLQVLSESKMSFSAKSDGRTCEYLGRIYQNGETFRAGCKHQCSCIDGAVGCAPLCTNQLPPASHSCPYPHLTRIPGQCCPTVDCHKRTWRLLPKHQVFSLHLFCNYDKRLKTSGL